MIWLRAFLAGFIATLVFHQGLLGLLYLGGIIAHAPYNMASTWPLGFPAVISLAFWGGLWGLVLWPCIRGGGETRYWLAALAIGAIGPTAVALLVVFPLKGIPIGLATIVFGLILNGVWGVGTAALLRLGNRRRIGQAV